MDIALNIGILLVGFAILVFSGDLLVQAAVAVATRMSISPAVIAVTLVALGTSAPELLTSILAALQGAADVAVGNVFGSNIFNILGVLGVTAIILPVGSSQELIKVEVPAFLLSALLFVGLCFDGQLSHGDGFVCLSLLVLFWWISISRSKNNNSHVNTELELVVSKKSLSFDLGLLTLSIIILVCGAKLTLYGGIELGKIFGLSDRLIGLTIISIGTGLPELATSAVAAFRGRNDIALGNVIGSNVLNILGVAGATSTMQVLPINKAVITFDMWWLLGATAVVTIFCIAKNLRIGKVAGVGFLTSYVVYLWMLF